MATDVYFKKVIPFTYRRQALKFRVSQDLFSSFDIDLGTQHLLRTLAKEEYDHLRSVLDVGCGYGPLGLALKKANPSRFVAMLDRDALAVEYARQNAQLNGVADAVIYGALGYDQLPQPRFDLIVSNIPAKAGTAAIAYLLRDAAFHLEPNGIVAVVVITAIDAVVKDILTSTPGIEILLQQGRPGHVAYHYRFREPPDERGTDARRSVEHGVYERGEATITVRGLRFSLSTAYSLPEFETLSYATDLLIEGLQAIRTARPARALLFNPGQGHVPVALAKLATPGFIDLVDRDLLALEYSKRNLIANGVPPGDISVSHQVGIASSEVAAADLIAGVLREDEGRAAIAQFVRQAAACVRPGGHILLAGTSTAITRIVELVQAEKLLDVRDRRRRSGHSVVLLRPR